ncbi:MAG TPA: amino acid adenylation domain-containing protein, partial [Candidatus Deferrimicrobium sp.]|nr:amino acid adenylation domain-containing protein [Candidatus Deferrimicrobium sp.]
ENVAQTAKFDLTFTAVELAQKTFFSIQYCAELFKKETIERFIMYFKKIVRSIVNEPGIKLQHTDIIPEQEKERLIVVFNNTDEVYSIDKTIYHLVEEQVERTPDYIALSVLSVRPVRLSYRELNKKSNQLAYVLRGKGITHNAAVALMIRRSTEMIVSILGILKSGGAYLPIDYSYPRERKQRMLKDSAAKLLLMEGNEGFENIGACESIDIRDKDLFNGNTQNPGIENRGDDLIYTIFTSGSTGLPKGSGVYHRGFMNLMHWYVKEFALNSRDSVLLLTSLSFDLTQKNIYAPLSVGGILHIPGSDYFEPSALLQKLWKNRVTWINCTPGMFYKLIEVKEDRNLLSGLRYVFLGGEPISVKMLLGWLESAECNAELVNTYGPTECTDVCTYYRLSDWKHYREGAVPIGKPIYNMQLYVLNRDLQIIPMGAAGELFIAGAGVGAGYLNHGQLTCEKFVKISLTGNRPVESYRTGDLARWLQTGNIEFLGRIDHQVKIRGFRVELGEIEKCLLNYPGINEAVVWAREEGGGDKSLCAYIVSHKKCDATGIREFLAKELPGYMIPSYFVQLEKIPLTSNGKVNGKALPKPELDLGEIYTAPRNEMEEKLVEIWAGVLGKGTVIDRIGIDASFFELGGHSLKATVLAARIHKELNVKLPLAELFKNPTIRGLAEYIRGNAADIYESIMPVEEKEYYGLSFAQQRMYILQQMDLNNTAYNMPEIIPLTEEIDIDRLEGPFKKLLKRHDSLRTSFHMTGDQPVQVVHPGVDFKIEKFEEPVVYRFVRAFDLSQAPLLRVGQFKSCEGKNYLAVDMHHIISDGVSHQILREDFTALYEGKELPPLRLQYKDFAQWQNSPKEIQRLDGQMSYWLKEFAGEIPVLELPMDYPRPISQSFAGNSIDFEIATEDTRALNKIALQGGATLFMVLAAAVNILLSKLSGQEEIIVGTPMAGRRHADLEKIIGMFVNTLALRNFPAGDRTFKEFLADIKERVLMAFENQEYPFEALVDKVAVKRDMGRNPLFDVMFVLQNMYPGIIDGSEEAQSETDKNMAHTAKFDLTFTAVEIGRKTLFSIQYCTKLFKQETIERFSYYFKKIVSQIIGNPGLKLRDLEIIPDEERRR